MTRRTLIPIGTVVLAAAIAVVVLDPFGGPAAQSSNGSLDNGSATSLATVKREAISSQTLVSATLGYAHTATIVVPGGTSETSIQQAQQSLTTAQGQLGTAQATLTADQAALAQAQATRVADRARQAVDCRGDNAAQTGTGGACAGDMQAASADEQAVTTNLAKVAADERALASAQTAAGSAESALATAESAATSYGQSATFTSLPAVGTIVARGETLYEIGGAPVVLLFGTVTAWRPFVAGMSSGRDVAELNANLRALGYGSGLSGDVFTDATAAAISALQAHLGVAQTGALLLGSVVFQPGAVRVTSVTPSVGATVQPGPVLGVTSTTRQVTIALDAAQQASIKVGDPVQITLPDNSTTPGKVSYVGTVATTPNADNGGGGSSTPTIEVDVTPTDPAATGRLDQAPVSVAITTASVPSALVVPVNALVALAGGGYAVEVAGGTRSLVAVEVGLFDDADGVVQVQGDGLSAGLRVVVPAQ